MTLAAPVAFQPSKDLNTMTANVNQLRRPHVTQWGNDPQRADFEHDLSTFILEACNLPRGKRAELWKHSTRGMDHTGEQCHQVLAQRVVYSPTDFADWSQANGDLRALLMGVWLWQEWFAKTSFQFSDRKRHASFPAFVKSTLAQKSDFFETVDWRVHRRFSEMYVAGLPRAHADKMLAA